MTPVIRFESTADIPAVRIVNELAFGRSLEADIVDALRSHEKILASLVALVEGQIVGHALFSRATIHSDGGLLIEAALGPLAVIPEQQRRGIGSALVQKGLAECRRRGFGSLFLLGSPAYYGRFGFRPAHEFGIHYAQPLGNEDAFQVVELREGALQGVRGIAH